MNIAAWLDRESYESRYSREKFPEGKGVFLLKNPDDGWYCMVRVSEESYNTTHILDESPIWEELFAVLEKANEAPPEVEKKLQPAAAPLAQFSFGDLLVVLAAANGTLPENLRNPPQTIAKV
jgi:hypothetical protein